MAREDRGKDHSVVQDLLEKGQRYSFFGAVRLLESLCPNGRSIGRRGPPRLESVRFTPKLSMDFEPSEVARIQRTTRQDGEVRFDVETNFMSLYGAVSPLPACYSEAILAEGEDGFTKGFLDIFNHRLISLFYRAWAKYRYSARFRWDSSDEFTQQLRTLVNVGSSTLPQDHAVPATRLLAYAGLFLWQPHSAMNLQSMLQDYFPDASVSLTQFVPRWQAIPPEQQSALGRNTRLGEDFYLGTRVRDRSSTFRLSSGPLSLRSFLDSLPGRPRDVELRELVDLYNVDNLDYEVHLTLHEDEQPEFRLGSDTTLLGWTSWLGVPRGPDSSVNLFCKGWFHGRN